MNSENPRFFFGIVTKGEDPMETWEKNKPKMWVSGAGWVFQASAKLLNVEPTTRIQALEYLHRECIPTWYAYIVPIEENRDNVTHMWGVWLAGPDDLFVEGSENAYMSDHQIANHYKDYKTSIPRNWNEPVEFLRL